MNKKREKKYQKKQELDKTLSEIYNITKENKEIFSTTLKFSREIKKLSQNDIAEKINVDRSTISKYERGEAFPSIKNFKKLIKMI